MSKDYITLLLVNRAGGLGALAFYFVFGAGKEDRRAWAPAMLMPGLVAFLVGLHMTLTWPIPKLDQINLAWANIAYGEMSVLLGVLFLAAALALGKGWSLAPIGVYGGLAAAVAIVVGVRIYALNLTLSPLISAVGFVVTGAAGLASASALCNCCGRVSRGIAAALLLAAAGLWAIQGAMAYWAHLATFSALK